MRKKTFTALLVLVVAIVSVRCGGSVEISVVSTQPTQAVLKLSTTGSGVIAAIDVTVQMPAGVTFRDAAPSGVAAAANPVDAVNTNVPGTVRIGIISINGFGAGEFYTVTCDIAAGSKPGAADFLISHFEASDSNGSVLTDIAPVLSVEIQ